VGLRREMTHLENKSASFAGFRTMSMVTGLGCLLTFFPQMPALPLIGFVGILVFVILAYGNGLVNLKLVGMTSEIMTVFMYLTGVLIGYGEIVLGIFLTVLVGAMTAFKSEMHSFAGTISKKEWIGAMELLIVSALILPFLPREAVDPWGVIVPFEVWLLVIAISGISFFGYFLHKYLGGKHSIMFSAFAGSMVSSTATAIHFAVLAKDAKDSLIQVYVAGLMVAIATMFARICLVVFVLAGATSVQILIPLVVMFLVSLVISYLLVRNIDNDVIKSLSFHREGEKDEYKSPFEIVPALMFAGLFVVILVIVAIANSLLGATGVIGTAALAATVDIDAITLTVLESLSASFITIYVAATALLVGSIVNTVVKVFYVWSFSRNKKFTKQLARYVIYVTFAGVAAFPLGFLFL